MTDARAEDIGASLATTRTAFEERAVVLGEDREELLRHLARFAQGDDTAAVRGTAGRGKTAFLFAGQGAQRLGMGRDLHAAFPVFAAAFDEICAHLDPELPQPLADVVFGQDAAALDRTGFTQPALFAFEVALFRLVASWGRPPISSSATPSGNWPPRTSPASSRCRTPAVWWRLAAV